MTSSCQQPFVISAAGEGGFHTWHGETGKCLGKGGGSRQWLGVGARGDLEDLQEAMERGLLIGVGAGLEAWGSVSLGWEGGALRRPEW